MHLHQFLHGVGSFCRIPQARIIGKRAQGGDENICKMRQFLVKRGNQKELRSRLTIMHLPRLGSNGARLLPVILVSFRWRGTHLAERSRDIL